MASELVYVFGDILTGEIIADTPMQGVSMASHLDGGELRGTVALEQTGRDHDILLSSTEPGRRFVIAERNGVPIWGGLVWTRTYQSQSKTAQLYCRDLKAYPSKRYIRTDHVFTDVEQTSLFLDLYTEMQSDPASIQVELPAAITTGVTRTVQVAASEYRTYESVLDTVANADDGFDWVIKWYKVGGSYTRKLVLGFPVIGALESPNMPVLEYYDLPGRGEGGNIINYWENDTMAGTGTHIYGIGGGEGDAMLQEEYIHTSLIDAGMPRFDTSVSFKDILSETALSSLLMQQAILRKSPGGVLTIEVKGDDPNLGFGDYSVGDAVKVFIQDPRHPEGLDKTKRLLGWEYYPPSDDSIEYVRLSFEGEDIE